MSHRVCENACFLKSLPPEAEINILPYYIPYECTVEVTNRFRGLDLIDRVPEELWTKVHDIVQETDQDHPQEKEMQKSKMTV